MNSEPQCLWTTGVITKDYTALPETEHMKSEDISLSCTEKADKVYIDGSATKIGASAYAGWGKLQRKWSAKRKRPRFGQS
eukprot:4371835-Heterocapsa_arctica.AAC.1